MTDTWKRLVEEGNDSYSRGKSPEAEVKFLAALEEAEKFGEDDARLALTLNNLAAMYHEQGKYTMAEPHYKRALDIRIRIYGENQNHPDIALNHHNLAVLYSARRMYPMAENHYKLAVTMKEELYGKDGPELINTLTYYAQLMKVQNRLVERQMLAARVKTIASKNENEAGCGSGCDSHDAHDTHDSSDHGDSQGQKKEGSKKVIKVTPVA